ncbi:MAG: transglycosylase SLT domain-containing protein [bacterium]|nr:transglycosylase SLT domain-containing protein [bacterium]
MKIELGSYVKLGERLDVASKPRVDDVQDHFADRLKSLLAVEDLENNKTISRYGSSNGDGVEGGSYDLQTAAQVNLTNLTTTEADALSAGDGVVPLSLGNNTTTAAVKISAPDVNIPSVAPVRLYQSVQGILAPQKSVTTPQILSVRRIERPKDSKDISADIRQLSNNYGISPNLAVAVARAESSLNPQAVSSDGNNSKGLFQLLDSTAAELMNQEGISEDYAPFDPLQNTRLGLRYLNRLHGTFDGRQKLLNGEWSVPAQSASDLERFAVAAFNAGEGRVAQAQRRAEENGRNPADFSQVKNYLPEITQDYIDRVFSYRDDEASSTS